MATEKHPEEVHRERVVASVRSWLQHRHPGVEIDVKSYPVTVSRFIYWLPDHGRMLDLTLEAFFPIRPNEDIPKLMDELGVPALLDQLPADWVVVIRASVAGGLEAITELASNRTIA